MSRSYKKINIYGIAGDSEKLDKRHANRKLRRKSRELINQTILTDEELDIFPEIREVSEIWLFAKDGKVYDNSDDINSKKMKRK